MTQVATQEQWTPQDVINAVQPEFKQLAQGHNAVKWEAECNYAIQQIYKNDFAIKTAQRNPVSVQNAVRNVAAIGLTLNPAHKRAYLVPRDGAIQLEVSYMGLMHLAQDTGSIMWAQAKIVHENDTYENKGASAEPLHTYSPFGERGNPVGAYCVAKTADGDYLTHEMPIDDIYAIRDRSMAWKKGQSGPWKTDEKEMIRKTVVKQASKYWPKVERMQEAIEMVNTSGEGIDFDAERNEPNQVGYDPASDAALLHSAFEADDWAAFQSVVRRLDEYQLSKLYKPQYVNTKIRAYGHECNRKMAEMVADLQAMIQSEDQEGFVETWNELTDSERTLMRGELPREQVVIARDWVLAEKQAKEATA